MSRLSAYVFRRYALVTRVSVWLACMVYLSSKLSVLLLDSLSAWVQLLHRSRDYLSRCISCLSDCLDRLSGCLDCLANYFAKSFFKEGHLYVGKGELLNFIIFSILLQIINFPFGTKKKAILTLLSIGLR